jgi:hypothetical protein
MPRILRLPMTRPDEAVFHRRYGVADAGTAIVNAIPAHPQN